MSSLPGMPSLPGAPSSGSLRSKNLILKLLHINSSFHQSDQNYQVKLYFISQNWQFHTFLMSLAMPQSVFSA